MTQEKFKFPGHFISTDSGGVGSDDKIFCDWKETLCGKLVEISIKYDGENTTLYADGSGHDRSIDSKKRLSRDALTSIWKAKGRYALPDGWRTKTATQYCVQGVVHAIPLHCNY